MASGASSAACAAPMSSSTGSADSYNGDDVRHYLYYWNETHDLYSGATREIGRLELCMEATQTALSATEGETTAARTMLVNANARVVGNILFSSELLLQCLLCLDLFSLFPQKLWSLNFRRSIKR
jgi:hypothetical protein